MKALFDSSVLFSGKVHGSLATSTALHLASRGRFTLCVSEAILEETANALLRKSKELGLSHMEIAEYITYLLILGDTISELPKIEPVCRDPNDDHVLAAAWEINADVLVTGDKDLLSLGQYKAVEIVSVRTFLDLMQK
jgi:putative PIN family toxin of toxin-antitoxin system